jgi:hypothetical protein
MAVALVATAQTAHAAEDSPRSVIGEHFPAMRELWGTMLPESLALEARLARRDGERRYLLRASDAYRSALMVGIHRGRGDDAGGDAVAAEHPHAGR